jgi:hypothetical protein
MRRVGTELLPFLTNPDLVAIVAILICAIGLLVTFALFLWVPSAREVPTSIQQML